MPVAQRTVTEEFALDSYQNVLFSICRFREIVGHYPDKITVVSFTFKKLLGIAWHCEPNFTFNLLES